MKIYYCYISGKPIPEARVEFLKESGLPEHLWTVVEHSQARKPQGIYFGEQGAGELRIVSKVYSERVSEVFDIPEDTDSEEKD